MNKPRRIDGQEELEPNRNYEYYCTPDGVLEALQNPVSDKAFLSFLRKYIEPLNARESDFKKDLSTCIDALNLHPDEGVEDFLRKQMVKFRNEYDIDANKPFIRHFEMVIELLKRGKTSKEKVERELRCLISLLP